MCLPPQYPEDLSLPARPWPAQAGRHMAATSGVPLSA